MMLLFSSISLNACVVEVTGKTKGATISGQSSTVPITNQVSGKVIFEDYQSGPITLQARIVVPCEKGICLVQGVEPLAEFTLNQPGIFQLFFQTQYKDVIILATHTDSNGQTRLKYKIINAFASIHDSVTLSLDSPGEALY